MMQLIEQYFYGLPPLLEENTQSRKWSIHNLFDSWIQAQEWLLSHQRGLKRVMRCISILPLLQENRQYSFFSTLEEKLKNDLYRFKRGLNDTLKNTSIVLLPFFKRIINLKVPSGGRRKGGKHSSFATPHYFRDEKNKCWEPSNKW